ncbi:hypothetical protein A2V71_00265 [Candidatus Berkelbacteria bacterium RBG_13_40_8]|uniref:NlpC/P60 domain-containing protein n=1 Tax=Candidatus Berkelbacteria bacterium RBG_13_40_8 TaxID=1797467 RepID=A0A1F5DNL6_9BACT|nr:MAG: hypothetical protein A2V71_00265 [Candidatus Berkelbacteria bacterium RBG_13_40_8]
MDDLKKLLMRIGCVVIVLLFFGVTAVFAGFNRGDPSQFKYGGTNVSLCSSVPEPYKTIFSAAGNKFQVQPAFIAAIFYAGEHANSWPDADGPWKTSPAGAKGPFQFMDPTWGSHKQDGNGDGVMDVQNLWDAAFGAAHLLANIGAGGNTSDVNNLQDAASKYNSGRPWSVGQGIPETAAYVPRVIAAYESFNCAGVAQSECAMKVVSLAMNAVGTSNATYLPKDPAHACAAFTTTILTQAGAISSPNNSAQGFWDKGGGQTVIPQGGQLNNSVLKPGDAVFFTGTYDNGAYFTHVGVYIGNDRVINTSSVKGVVDNDSLTGYGHFGGAKRYCAT